MATYKVEVDWNADGDFLDTYDDIIADIKSIRYSRGKDEELGKALPGELGVRVNNSDGKYSPTLTTGDLYEELLPKRAIRVRGSLNAFSSGDWLGTWAKRIQLTIDKDDIDATLTWHPVPIHLSTSSGISSTDVSAVFDELTLDANRKKIAITKEDGLTQLYVEIEKWDDGNEEAWLHVSKDGWEIASDADTIIYLYYDSTQDDNDTYVGDTNDEVAENVWDANFALVTHMRDDPDTSHVRDSTSNDNDGTKLDANKPIVTTSGKIDDAQDFTSATKDYITMGGNPSGMAFGATGGLTVSYWIKGTGTSIRSFGRYTGGQPYWGHVLYNNAVDWYAQGYLTSAYSNVLDGTWHYITSLRTDNGTTIATYVDGAFIDDGTVDAVDLDSVTAPLSIGRWGLLDTGNLDGMIDEFRISSTDRTAAWIKASFESGRDHLIDFGSEETFVYSLFYGFIETITPHPDPASQDCYISAIDGLDFLARHELDTALYKNALTGTIHGHILDSAAWSATMRAIDAGQDTVPFWFSSGVRARFAQNEIDDSELAFSYINGAGNFVFEDRHHRYSATHQTSQATFNDTMVDITYDYSARNIHNEVRATVTPWEVQSLATLWVLEENPSIDIGQTKTWWGEASVSGIPAFVDAWTTPAAGTDYIIHSEAEGAGDVETGNVTVETTKFAQSIKIAITNDAAHVVYVTTLQARGTPYDDQTKVTRKSEDATSQTAYQKRTLSLEGKYLTDAETAQDFCDYGIARFKDPQAEITLTILNKNSTNLTQILTREISDRITVQNTKLGLDADFFINKMEHVITEGGKIHRCTWFLVDAEAEDFWLLDHSALGVGTKIGY